MSILFKLAIEVYAGDVCAVTTSVGIIIIVIFVEEKIVFFFVVVVVAKAAVPTAALCVTSFAPRRIRVRVILVL